MNLNGNGMFVLGAAWATGIFAVIAIFVNAGLMAALLGVVTVLLAAGLLLG